MLKKTPIIIIIIIVILTFFLGLYLGSEYSILNKSEPLHKNDYYNLFINSFIALGTCSTVIVALFMEEIRSIFKYVKFEIDLKNSTIRENLNEEKVNHKEANYYHNEIEINNKGTINALDCEFYLEKATFIKDNVSKDVEVSDKPIKIGESNQIYIPCLGKKIISIFKLIKNEKTSTPNSNNIKNTYTYELLGHKSIDAEKGTWKLTYCINSTTSKPYKFTIKIYWDGKWECRQSEMKNNLTINIKSL